MAAEFVFVGQRDAAVFLSGGEPLRRDLPEIVDMYSSFIIGLSTNATPRPDHGAAAGRGG